MPINNNTCCWFQAESRLGRVHIGVEIDEQARINLEGPHRVFQQAALIEKTELFIQALELWQQIDLDLLPCTTPEDSPIRLFLTLKETAQNEDGTAEQLAGQGRRGITVVFPFDSLARLVPFSEELDAVINLESSDVAVQVELDDFQISAAEFNLLEEGAVVVLPKSYQSDWKIAARSITPELELNISGMMMRDTDIPTVLLTPNKAGGISELAMGDLSADNAPENAQQITHSVAVRLQEPSVVSVSQLLGRTEVQLPLSACELSLILNEQVVAHGSLLSYGRGSVLAVSELVATG